MPSNSPLARVAPDRRESILSCVRGRQFVHSQSDIDEVVQELTLVVDDPIECENQVTI